MVRADEQAAIALRGERHQDSESAGGGQVTRMGTGEADATTRFVEAGLRAPATAGSRATAARARIIGIEASVQVAD